MYNCEHCEYKESLVVGVPCLSCSDGYGARKHGTKFEAKVPLPSTPTGPAYREAKERRERNKKAAESWLAMFDEPEQKNENAQPENNGHNGNYYSLRVERPMKVVQPYTVECADVIENLRMDFNEGEAFKAIWRKAARRLGNIKPGSDDLYDAQKVAHYGARMEAMSNIAKGK
jgi:hypothetical protein